MKGAATLERGAIFSYIQTVSKVVSLLLVGASSIMGCGGEDAGTCSQSCGGYGTGQPFVQINTPFKTREDCIKMGQARTDCKTSFCPPTGNPSDCYQVWP